MRDGVFSYALVMSVSWDHWFPVNCLVPTLKCNTTCINTPRSHHITHSCHPHSFIHLITSGCSARHPVMQNTTVRDITHSHTRIPYLSDDYSALYCDGAILYHAPWVHGECVSVWWTI